MRNFNKYILKEIKFRKAQKLIIEDYKRSDWNSINCKEKEILREFGITEHEYFVNTWGINFRAPKHFRKDLNRVERVKSKSHMRKIKSSYEDFYSHFTCECLEEPFNCYDQCCNKFDSLLCDSQISCYKGADWQWG